MGDGDLIWERAEALRDRARWYRAYAEANPADRARALSVAAELERRADELERKLDRSGGPSG